VAILLTLVGCAQFLGVDTTTPRMTKEELRPLLGNPDVIILDVRLESEWESSESKIRGAVRENLDKDIQTWANKYPREKTLVFYCS